MRASSVYFPTLMDFGDSIGLLIFLFFLFLQFVASLFGRKKKGKRPDAPPGEPVPAGSTTERAPTSFEEALRQIQEALKDANAPRSAPPASTDEAEFVDEENSLGFQHFDDFEQRGADHFESGAHVRYEAEEARRAEAFGQPLRTDRPTLMERKVAGDALRGQRDVSEINTGAVAARTPRAADPSESLDRLRAKLRSPEAVQDAYRLHVILGEPKARKRR